VRLAALAPDGRALAYVRTEGNGESLWLRRALSDVEVVAPIDGFFRSLTFGPDEHLYYTAFVSNRTDVGLYRVSTAGGSPEQLLDAGAGISFSPDGSRMAYVSTVSFSVHESRLVVASRDGVLLRVIAVRTPPLSFANIKPAWSANGNALAAIVVNEQTPLSVDLLTVDAANGQPLDQIRLQMASVSGLAWLADGTRVLSGRSRQALPVRLWSLSPGSSVSRPMSEDVSDYELVGISGDGRSAVAVRRETARTLWASDVRNLAGARQIAVDSGSIDGFEGIAWAGNREVLYPAVEADNVDIFAVDLSSGMRRRLTSDPGDDFHPSASADGRWVAFATDREGRSSTWIMQIDGSRPRRLTQGVDSRPALSPDARWVVVQRNGVDSAPSTMWRVVVDTGEAVRLGALQSYRPSVSPDGKYVAHYWMTPEQWTLAVTPAAGGLPVRTLPIRGTHLERVVRWSPDGKGLAFIDTVGGAGNIWLQSLDGNTAARPLTHMATGRMVTFDWSRDGSRLAWTTVTEVSDVVAVACCPDRLFAP
jgi:Tol biopolymer transport system component